MIVVADPRTIPAEHLVAALAGQHFDDQGACFAGNCRMRAFTPNNVFGAMDWPGITATYRTWFGDAQSISVIEQSVDAMSDRLRIRYLLDVTEDGERTLCEQFGYFDVVEGKIVDITLICSGNRPFAEAIAE